MLQPVDVGQWSLAAYQGIVGDDQPARLADRAAPLRGLRVLQLNATPYGGGVSEMLRSAVPLLNDLGLVVDWRIIAGDRSFFDATKALHNGLQGADADLTGAQREAYLATSRRNAGLLDESYDVVIAHDPQPAAIRGFGGGAGARWVWRCHIDTSAPNPGTWAFFRPFLDGYDAAVFTLNDFVPRDLPVGDVVTIPPAIDALSPKNIALPDALARQVLDWIGLRLDMPLIAQVARFDPWKDPMGVIQAYRLVRERIPRLQLVLAGSMALDDPEAWGIYERIRAEAEADPLIHVFTNLTGVGNIEVNAIQRLADVVVQKSVREGFGLVVSEALWKGTPVVAGRTGGIPLQMADGVGGYLVDDVPGCADAIERLLSDPAGAAELADAGRRRVREHFLLPRLLLNEIDLLTRIVNDGWRPRPADTEHDPVCGLAVLPRPDAPYVTVGDRTYRFCSNVCRNRFAVDPARWAPASGPAAT